MYQGVLNQEVMSGGYVRSPTGHFPLPSSPCQIALWVQGKSKCAVLHWSLGGVFISLSQAIEAVGGYSTESATHDQCDVRPTIQHDFAN